MYPNPVDYSQCRTYTFVDDHTGFYRDLRRLFHYLIGKRRYQLYLEPGYGFKHCEFGHGNGFACNHNDLHRYRLQWPLCQFLHTDRKCYAFTNFNLNTNIGKHLCRQDYNPDRYRCSDLYLESGCYA